MAEECDQGCSSCSSSDCADRQAEQDKTRAGNAASHVKKVIGIVSGKGGVGKSSVTSMLASAMAAKGYQVGILDADMTGASIPKAFGVKAGVMGSEEGLIPAQSAEGIRIISTNLMLQDETDPVIWRGAMIAGVVKQFWTDVVWGELDYLFIDMPPGTGDVILTAFQSLPIDGIVVVTAPQDLVAMIVAKAVNMAHDMQIPVLGLVENMSYFVCDECGKEHHIFGQADIAAIAAKYDIPVTATLPIDPTLASLCDAGQIGTYDTAALAPIVEALENVPASL
jgi:Mrp family chromosome partitioning ATPase